LPRSTTVVARRGGQVLEWSILGDTHRFDVEAFGLHHPEHLLDGPALAVEAGDPTCICERDHRVRGQQSPMHWRYRIRRIDFTRLA